MPPRKPPAKRRPAAGTRAVSAETIAHAVVATGDHNVIEVTQVHGGPAPSPAARRDAYLHHVLRAAGQLSLAGVDPKAAGRANEAVSLHEVYTALLTSSYDRDYDRIRAGSPEPLRPLSAVEQLDRHGRLVLLGEPGGGKSTFLNFVAMCLAGHALGDARINLRALTAPLRSEDGERAKKRQPWRHGPLLPVRVVLRDFAARGLPPPGDSARAQHLWDFIVAELSAATLGDFAPDLDRILAESGGLLLLDGLDEVPEADRRRAQIKQAVEGFADTHPRCRILVTSRTYAYQKQDWKLRDFAEAVLAPFGKTQRTLFIDRWYAHVGALRGMSDDDAKGRAALLKRAVDQSDRLQALAERPLLLTLMASLHAWRGGSLPERREELYADAVELLLDWWESPKVVRDAQGKMVVVQPSLAEWMSIEKERVRRFLDELACDAHAAQPDLVGAADIAEGPLVSGLLRISNNRDLKPARLVEYLSDRAGLLLPRGEGVYAFPHRTFQEYLAACHLTQHDYPNDLADRLLADPERWREVTLLAAAKAARGTASSLWSLAEALCEGEPPPDGRPVQAQALWGALLAGQAIAETADLAKLTDRSRPKVERIARWLVRVVRGDELPAIERARAGDALAKLGDPRFDPGAWYLPKEETLGFVEVAGGKFWMGSDETRDKLADHNELPRHEVELGGYWMGKYPVTVAQYRAFVEDSGHTPQIKECLRGLANHPVGLVGWDEAVRYGEWLTEKLRGLAETPEPLASLLREQDKEGRRWRVTLPSEAEWEKAARGEDGRIYPWGDEPDPQRASYDWTEIGTTSAVGCFRAGMSPYGCEEMIGNVYQWTRSTFLDYPYQHRSEEYEGEENKGDRCVVRGGSFIGDDRGIRCAARAYGASPAINIGFRVVVAPYL